MDQYLKEYRGRDDYALQRSRKALSGQTEPKAKKRVEAIDVVLKERGIEPEQTAAKEAPKEDLEPKTFDELLALKYTAKARNARQRGIDFDLSISDMRRLMKRKTCHYTGIQITDDCDPMEPQKRTLDRLDNTKGYTRENTVACSFAANALKNVIFEDPTSICRMNKAQLRKFVNKIGEQ